MCKWGFEDSGGNGRFPVFPVLRPTGAWKDFAFALISSASPVPPPEEDTYPPIHTQVLPFRTGKLDPLPVSPLQTAPSWNPFGLGGSRNAFYLNYFNYLFDRSRSVRFFSREKVQVQWFDSRQLHFFSRYKANITRRIRIVFDNPTVT